MITHKDRLLRFGAENIFSICEQFDIEVVIINKRGKATNFEEERVQNFLEMITVFSARLYGSRGHKGKKIIESLKETTEKEKYCS